MADQARQPLLGTGIRGQCLFEPVQHGRKLGVLAKFTAELPKHDFLQDGPTDRLHCSLVIRIDPVDQILQLLAQGRRIVARGSRPV